MIFNGKIKKLKEHDISDILTNLPKHDDPLWTLITSRQEKNSQHSQTNNIIFLRVGKAWDGTAGKEQLTNAYPEALTQACLKVANEVAAVLNGVPNHVTLIMLPAGKHVELHKDLFPLNKIHRCHVPITSNDRCEFNILGNKTDMEIGSSYEINNQLLHEAKNNGTTARVHLLVDVFPNASN
jgi:aspartyl/asparaginyl beta-hydroxylase (cupin superfamily)